MASVLVDGVGIDVDGFVCVPTARDGAYVSIRFRSDVALYPDANLLQRHEVRLDFEAGGSVHHGIFRLTAFTPGPGPYRYRFSSVGPIVCLSR